MQIAPERVTVLELLTFHTHLNIKVKLMQVLQMAKMKLSCKTYLVIMK